MNSLSRYLGTDHKHCDELFAESETKAGKQDWDGAGLALTGFAEALEQHLVMEEEVLFPEFEQAVGTTEGPTSVMRMEHRQMREILSMLGQCLARRDADAFLGYSETLNTMMQQHNMKEESILYPMMDRMLAGRHDELIASMRGVAAA